jgi:hypothetical protein
MDAYSFITGHFMGAIDWQVRYLPKEALAMGMINRSDLGARFHTGRGKQ